MDAQAALDLHSLQIALSPAELKSEALQTVCGMHHLYQGCPCWTSHSERLFYHSETLSAMYLDEC